MNTPTIVLAIIFSTLLILLLISGLAITFFVSARQRSKQQMELTVAQLNYEKELRKVENEVSENMQQHFSQELHDNIGHILTCIHLELENRKLQHKGLDQMLTTVDSYLDDAMKQLRLLSRSLNSDYVKQVGLVHAIHLEVERLQQLKKFHVHFEQRYSADPLDKDQELVIFRIFQEIMHNAMRHSRAKNVHIRLVSHPGFELTVQDDGHGFDVAETLKTPRASGLRNILKRSSMADLDCFITSAPEAGCRYQVNKRNPPLLTL